MPTLYKELPLEWLQRGRYQPRQAFDEHRLQELAQSILAEGLIEPLIVREISPERYEIIAGERRWRAAMIARLATVPCLISDYTHEQTAAISLIENIQREDLNLLEEASGYQRLHTEFNFNQQDIATLVGKSRSHIANLLRLLTLCPEVKHYLVSNQLSLGHARTLVGLLPQQQIALATQAIKKGWSVRQLEETVRQNKNSSDAFSPAAKDHHLEHLQTQLAEQMGTPVQIVKNEAGGWLKIKFFDNDTLAGLLEKMGLRYD